MRTTSRSAISAPSQPKKNWWPRFSLRTLFIFTTLCCIALGNVAWRLDRKWKQLQLIASTGAHGVLHYDYEYEQNEDGLSLAYLSDSIPERFPRLKWLGDDFFHDIISVSYNAEQAALPNASVDEMQVPENAVAEFFQHLNQLPNLRQLDLVWGRENLALYLSNARCRDTLINLTIDFEIDNWHDLNPALHEFKQVRELNLCHVAPHTTQWSFLANMPELRYLRVTQNADQFAQPMPILEAIPLENRIEVIDLDLARITPSGLAHLSRFPRLRELTLHSKLNSEILAPLSQSQSLTKLDLTDCQLTDEACEWLAQITNLETLILDQNPISDYGVKQFAKCKKLVSLALIDTQVTGAAWENPTDFPALSRLELDRCPIDSIGLQNIHRLPKLTSLRLANCPLEDKDFLLLTIPRSLTDLRIYGIPITRQTFEFYSQIESLEHFSSGYTLVSYEDIQELHSIHKNIFFVDSSLGYNVFFCGT